MGKSRRSSCTWLTGSVTAGISHDEIQPTVSAARASGNHRRLAWGRYEGRGDSRLAFSIQEALSFGDPGPGASSGTMATFGHHMAFSTRNQSNRGYESMFRPCRASEKAGSPAGCQGRVTVLPWERVARSRGAVFLEAWP